jgi:hypothetical protein
LKKLAVAKAQVCRVLGYPIPKSFRKTKPLARFPGQNLDTYVQAADNLQIWNAEISPARRYVLIRPDAEGIIRRVRVVTGAELAPLDRTGKLTRKFQARISDLSQRFLASGNDTSNLLPLVASRIPTVVKKSPIDLPEDRSLLSIAGLYAKLSPLVGRSFDDPGILQERNRGGLLHGLVSAALGYRDYADNGRFPDIRHQDIRYAVFCARINKMRVTITGLVLVTGKDFYSTFAKFGGLVINNKYQLPLPRDFFDRNTEGIFD